MVWKEVMRSESSRENTNEKALFEIFDTLLVKKGFNCTTVWRCLIYQGSGGPFLPTTVLGGCVPQEIDFTPEKMYSGVYNTSRSEGRLSFMKSAEQKETGFF